MKPDEYRKYLERRISIMQEEIDYLRGRLRALENGEDISDSDSDYEYPEYNGETLKGAKAYDSDDHFYLDNINGV